VRVKVEAARTGARRLEQLLDKSQDGLLVVEGGRPNRKPGCFDRLDGRSF